jgi:hypothetical protein
MYDNRLGMLMFGQSTGDMVRHLNPQDIILEQGYKIEVFIEGLDAPGNMAFTPEGDIVVGISGYISGKAEVLRLSGNQAEVVADNLEAPLSGIGYLDGSIYVSHYNKITEIRPDGTKRVIISGLPTNGDHFISNVVRGSDNKIYFGVGTVTNSGVVGTDNTWLIEHPFLCDYAGDYIMLNGQNYKTKDVFSLSGDAYTGAYSPYGIQICRLKSERGQRKHQEVS